jgi:hypothetical protein
MRYNGLIALGVGAVLAFAAATLPASVLGPRMQRYGVTAASWNGSIWNGAASGLSVKGAPLGEARWTLSPWSLLRGSASGHAQLQPSDGAASADFVLHFNGRVDLSRVEADVALPWLSSLAGPRYRGWKGRVAADFETLALQAGWPVAAKGTLRLQKLGAPPPRAGDVGSYQLVFDAPAPATVVQGRLSDIDGPLVVTGDLELGANRSFDLQGYVAPRGAARTPFDSAIEMLGPADASGRRPFGVSGTL